MCFDVCTLTVVGHQNLPLNLTTGNQHLTVTQVTYAPRSHCDDAPWWQSSTPVFPPSGVAYEGATDFDAYTATEALMSPAEVTAFLAAASPSPPLGALLIAETSGNSTRLWGAGIGATAAPLSTPTPFCDWGGAAGAYFLKTGGDPAKTEGWDQGNLDKCCSTDPSDCYWFGTLAGCQAFDPARCRQCEVGQSDMGCPSWTSGGIVLPLAAKYLDVPPPALATQVAVLAPNQNYSWQVLVVVPSAELATVANVSFSTVPGVTFSCFSTQVREGCLRL